jgi:hypothetical protein
MKIDEKDFVKLFEFVAWWKDYDFETHNWFNDENELNVKQTFVLIEDEFEMKISSDYERIAFSYNCLYLLDFDESIYL